MKKNESVLRLLKRLLHHPEFQEMSSEEQWKLAAKIQEEEKEKVEEKKKGRGNP